MHFVIEPVTDPVMADRAAYLREEVFGRELRLRVPTLPLHQGADTLTLIARPEFESYPVAVLTVIETTGDHGLHRRLGLTLPKTARVARFTQLAVLKPFRGLDLPARLVPEGRSQFIVPRQINYTWLLFDADRASSSSFCNALGFHAGAQTFDTEYGRSRVLLRNDGAAMPEPSEWEERAAPQVGGEPRRTTGLPLPVRRVVDRWLAR